MPDAVLNCFSIAAIWVLALTFRDSLESVLAIYAIAFGVMIVFQHRSNIQRLLSGNERRLGERV